MIKRIESDYDNESGISYVGISTKIGNFYGYAYLHPEDKDIASKYFGCDIAELRAYVEYFKQRIYINNIKLQALKNLKEKNQEALKTIKKIEENNRINKREIKRIKEAIEKMFKDRIEFLKKAKVIKSE